MGIVKLVSNGWLYIRSEVEGHNLCLFLTDGLLENLRIDLV